MKKSVLIIIIVAIVGILFAWGTSAYNGMVQAQESVNNAWSNVENQYQRRSDLIPNLVNTVKGYAEHERSTLEAVTEARAKATQMHIDGNDLTPEMLQQYQQVQGQVGSALSRLLAVSERYPDLKANENFMELQSQLEGTENRISVERRNFNEAARSYNTYIRIFPRNIFAGMFGFRSRPYFEAQPGSEQAPKVEF